MEKNYRNENTGVSYEEIVDESFDSWEGDDWDDDYNTKEMIEEINRIIESKVSEMTDACKQYYLDNREKYCDELDVDIDVSDDTYLWIVAQFDPDYHIHNI